MEDRRRSPLRLGFHLAHVTYQAGRTRVLRLRTTRMVLALRLRAAWHRAELDCRVAPDVRFGRRVRITVAARTRNVVHIGPRCVLGDDVVVELTGGALVVGPGVDVRPRCVLRVGGALTLAGGNLLQHGCTLHCAQEVTLGVRTTCGEYVSIVDSTHRVDGPHEWFVHNVATAPVVLGDDVWVAAKATVGRGVHVGDRAVIGANSVVVRDVPAGYLASGVPAAVRPLPPPAVGSAEGARADAGAPPRAASVVGSGDPRRAPSPTSSS